MWHFITSQLVYNVFRGPNAIVFKVKQLKNYSHHSSQTASRWRQRHNVPLKCQRADSRITQNLIPEDLNLQHHHHVNLKSQCHVSLNADYCLYLWFTSQRSVADGSNLQIQISKQVTLYTAHCVTFCCKSQDCNTDRTCDFKFPSRSRSELRSSGLFCSKKW